MSGEKARAINRAWEKWPNVDVETVAELVAAGWDACAAQPVQQPNRDSLIASLKVAMLGTTDGDFIEPESDIPAGEMFRLAGEWVEANLVALAVPATGEAATQYRAIWPGGGTSLPLPSLVPIQEEAARKGIRVVIQSRIASYTPWEKVTP